VSLAAGGLAIPLRAPPANLYSQLAAVAFLLALQMHRSGLHPALPGRIALGGDSEISYKAMLQALQQALPANDPARHCRICEISNGLFFLWPRTSCCVRLRPLRSFFVT